MPISIRCCLRMGYGAMTLYDPATPKTWPLYALATMIKSLHYLKSDFVAKAKAALIANL